MYYTSFLSARYIIYLGMYRMLHCFLFCFSGGLDDQHFLAHLCVKLRSLLFKWESQVFLCLLNLENHCFSRWTKSQIINQDCEHIHHPRVLSCPLWSFPSTPPAHRTPRHHWPALCHYRSFCIFVQNVLFLVWLRSLSITVLSVIHVGV